MIPTYTTSVGLPKICFAFEWPTQTKIPRTAPGNRSPQNFKIMLKIAHTDVSIGHTDQAENEA